ncbi:ABC-F family ATP-binding cassette domain-containing protein [Candidatus Uhrbacteria bacterium]|nr:ABC-F family ATP-binding cassette domain-containing protein [Candidatus Uhrbacteria bacterium]
MNGNITLKSIAYLSEDGTEIIKDIDLNLSRCKTGLVGRNGSGKTTLMRIVAGEVKPSFGQVIGLDGLRIAYLPQDYRIDNHKTLAETLEIEISDIDGPVMRLLDAVGLKEMELGRTMGSLSGGERMRVLLAAAMLRKPDYLMLDEPTNNLDSESRQFVYGLIEGWKGGLLVISHDRELLSRVDEIIELSGGKARKYGGNHDFYRQQKDRDTQAAKRHLGDADRELDRLKKIARQKREAQEKRMVRGQKARGKIGMGKAELNYFADRAEGTAGKIRGNFDMKIRDAQDRQASAYAKARNDDRMVVDLSGTMVPKGKTVAEIRDVTFRYGDGQPLLEKVNFEICGPERLAISGPNGSGKTTMIRLMTGQLEPESGEVYFGVRRWAYLDQHLSVLPANRVLADSVAERIRGSQTEARNWLARFGFANESALRTPKDLSGGERIRAALAYVLAGESPPQLLIMDEPTNSLDIETVERVAGILNSFEGALVVVSHDRKFLSDINVVRTVCLGRK